MNNPITYPNQNLIIVHKPEVKSNFLQIGNREWMYANKILTPYGLQLYLYIASNMNGFKLALSPEAAYQAAGIKKTSYHKYFKLLIEKGYLVQSKFGSNKYDFYTTPYGEPISEEAFVDDSENPIQDEKNELADMFDRVCFGSECEQSNNSELDRATKCKMAIDRIMQNQSVFEVF